MKKVLLLVLVTVGVVAGAAWLNKISLLLFLANQQADQKYADRQPFYQVPWQQGPTQPELPSRERPPNVILIVADDLGFNDISQFGGGVAGGKVKTPGIDQLAADGVVFEQSYSGHNTCAPSRAMLMTGRYPSRTGFSFTPTPDGMARIVSMIATSMDNGIPRARIDTEIEKSKPPYEEMGLPSSEITLAEVLKSKGYYTAHIGKWHLGRNMGSSPQAQGFDDSLLMASGLYLPEDSPNVVNAKLGFDPIDQLLWANMRYAASFNDTEGAGFMPGGYLTDYYTETERWDQSPILH